MGRSVSGRMMRSLIVSLFLGRSQEVIEEQTRLYRWACKRSDPYVLKVISNLSTAGCWAAEGRLDDWIQLYNEAAERLDTPEVSYYSRCEFLQSGGRCLTR